MNSRTPFCFNPRRGLESPVMTAFNRREAIRRAREVRRQMVAVALGASAAALLCVMLLLLCR